MAKCTFYDPVLGVTNTWLLNYEEMTGPDQQDQITYEGNAARTGIIGTMGDKAPLVMQMTGKCVHSVQYELFMRYKAMSNTFKFSDEDGNEYEVQMTGLTWTKKACSYNQFDGNMRRHYWAYSMQLTIIRVISGDLLGLI